MENKFMSRGKEPADPLVTMIDEACAGAAQAPTAIDRACDFLQLLAEGLERHAWQHHADDKSELAQKLHAAMPNATGQRLRVALPNATGQRLNELAGPGRGDGLRCP
jgi:hypothetical protein